MRLLSPLLAVAAAIGAMVASVAVANAAPIGDHGVLNAHGISLALNVPGQGLAEDEYEREREREHWRREEERRHAEERWRREEERRRAEEHWHHDERP